MMTKIKTKKSLFIVFAVIMLVISLSLNITGAWFTDSAGTGDAGVEIKFGTVKIEEKDITINLPDQLLPNLNITFAPINYVGNVNAYYRIFFSIVDGSYTGSSPTLDELKDVLKANTVQYGTFDVSTTSGTTVTPNTINIASTTGNKFQGVSCQYKVTIQVIQQANIPGIESGSTPTDSQLQTVFETYYS
jgi:hypothetical protein